MAWITTKSGKHINTDWFDDEKAKERQIAANKAQADVLNGKRKKRVNQENLTSQKIQEEIVGKDSYILDPEYQALSKEAGKHWDKMGKADDKRRELEEQLKTESKMKPKEEWDEEDELMALLGQRPMTYTEKGKQISAEIERLRSVRRDAEKEWEKITDKIEKIDEVKTKQSREKWLKNKGEDKIKNADKDDYFGFKKAETTTPYIDDLLRKGDAQVVSMPPKTYIEQAAYRIFNNSSVEKVIRGRNPKDVARYMTMMEQGVKFDTPYLNFRDSQQEGLHRAIAAYMMGIEEMPVIIVERK